MKTAIVDCECIGEQWNVQIWDSSTRLKQPFATAALIFSGHQIFPVAGCRDTRNVKFSWVVFAPFALVAVADLIVAALLAGLQFEGHQPYPHRLAIYQVVMLGRRC